MDHRVPHDLGRALAKKATVAAFSAYSAKYAEYNPRMAWTDDYTAKASFNVKGFELKGKVEVREREVTLDLDVPLLLRPFKAKALDVIEREIRLWVEKAKRGEI
jgi:hypothetical protein